MTGWVGVTSTQRRRECSPRILCNIVMRKVIGPSRSLLLGRCITVKIILSRKGFDGGTGRVPSPIFPSGEMCSLPIPETMPHDSPPIRYQEIMMGSQSLGKLVDELTKGEIKSKCRAHLDPDLNPGSISTRPAHWKPVFGQGGIAEGHLQKQGVREGDVFIFFGWFREVDEFLRIKKDASNLHVIFGWLQIERRIPVNDLLNDPSLKWAAHHPHYKKRKYDDKLDCIYISTDLLELPDRKINRAGAGIFSRFDDSLQLTEPGKSRSVWRLPSWFDPRGKKSGLTYHGKKSRWKTLNKDRIRLNSVGRGQEFVLDCDDYPEAIPWLASLLEVAT